MKSIHISIKDLTITIRDWQGLIIFLIMPLVLTAILGGAMGSSFDSRPSLARFTVGYVNNDGGHLAEALKDIFKSAQLQEMIELKEMTEAEARELLIAEKLQVALLVPERYTESIFAGQDASLLVLKDPGANLRPMIVEGIANSFVEHVSASRVALALATTQVAAGGQPTLNPMEISQRVTAHLQTVYPKFQEQVSQPDRSLISAFQYYAAAMAVMFMMSAGSVGLESIAVEKRNLTWDRLMSSPTSPVHLILGKFFSVMLVNSCQFVVLMLGTTLLYKVNWGDSMLQVIIAGVCYSVAISGLSLLVASLIPSGKAGLATWNIGVQVCAALGGSMVPWFIFPKAIQAIARFSPNFWGIRMFTSLMSGQALSLSLVMPILLIGMGALTIGSGYLIFQQRRA